jgi:glucose/mannose-6-phosphate isomerase
MVEQAAVNLDDLKVYRKFDSEGMLKHLHTFPVLCQQAWEMIPNFKLPRDYAGVKKIIILGMGGSAIGGDLVSSLAVRESRIPVLVCRDYDLPQHVDSETLVIASSYSGATEETLSAFKQSFDTPARKLAITTGGKLKNLCDIQKVPVITFSYRSQPRAALPFSFFILLGILHNLGILPEKPADITETFTNLTTVANKFNERIPAEMNPAKTIAQKLWGRLPIIYGAGITAEVAHRWKTQINENSKTMAYYEVFSELNHNSIVGYGLPEELNRQAMVVMLDSDLLNERVRLRYQITRQLLEQAGIYCQTLNGEGVSPLSQMLTLILLGDYVSYYLAMLNQVDPSPVQPIDFLKKNLANR